MNLIIIDDEVKTRRGMRNFLEGRGNLRVLADFAEAQSALNFLYENKVDLILTDIQMPGLQGLDMIQKIREVNQEIPIIIISGYSRFDYAQRAIELGVRKYMIKPVAPAELLQVLEQLDEELHKHSLDLQQRLGKLADAKPIDNLLVLKAMDYVDRHYQNKFTLKDMADALYISPNYLSELFKKTSGMKFSDYLLEVRMKKSEEYLADLSYKIGDISSRVGFSDPRYFSSAFRKKYHMTPLEYRNKVASKSGT